MPKLQHNIHEQTLKELEKIFLNNHYLGFTFKHTVRQHLEAGKSARLKAIAECHRLYKKTLELKYIDLVGIIARGRDKAHHHNTDYVSYFKENPMSIYKPEGHYEWMEHLEKLRIEKLNSKKSWRT